MNVLEFNSHKDLVKERIKYESEGYTCNDYRDMFGIYVLIIEKGED